VSDAVAIITGAGGGIGRAAALELARRGYQLALVGRTEKTLRETSQAVSRDALVIRADVTRVDEVDAIVEQVTKRFGRIDVLVNNAGMAPVLSIEQTTPQIWHQVIDTNLSAVFYLCRACWPVFKKQRSGVVVNISSAAAKDPFNGFLAYGAAKAALNNFGISLAREGAAIGVLVHTIAPGAVETPMLRGILSAEQFPSENTLAPADVARVVGQWASGDLRHTSGQVIWHSRQP
jgi:NAD(P)-dependent dehydrogenase (short-subunit alcohol dehydrogenase family)